MTTPSLSAYALLRKKIEKTLLFGQQKIEEAKVRTYWETGQLINQHLERLPGKRQERHQQVVARLSKDLGLGEKVFYRCMRFAESFPYFSARRNMTWAHYRALIAVPDQSKRLALADEASREAWSSRDLEIEIRNLLWAGRVEASEGKAPSLLSVPALGPFWAYRILDPETTNGKLLVDLGFSCCRHLDAVTSKTFKSGDIVESVKTGDGLYKLQKTDRTPDTLYVYRAQIEKIVDGDTLRVVVDLGFDTTTRQYIRLRAIDCPEMDTSEGKTAKRFVENALQGLEFITLKTVEPDKYDRYLGDVFLPVRSLKASTGGTGATGPGCYTGKTGELIYLNNLLLEKGYAVKVRS